MNEDDIPPYDPDLVSTSNERDSANKELLEFRALNAEADLNDLLKKEVGQRRALKWVAVGVGLGALFFMAFVLIGLVNKVIGGEPIFMGSAIGVAIIVAPITSITTITVAFFYGAFRKFEDKDIDAIQNGISAGSKILGGGN